MFPRRYYHVEWQANEESFEPWSLEGAEGCKEGQNTVQERNATWRGISIGREVNALVLKFHILLHSRW